MVPSPPLGRFWQIDGVSIEDPSRVFVSRRNTPEKNVFFPPAHLDCVLHEETREKYCSLSNDGVVAQSEGSILDNSELVAYILRNLDEWPARADRTQPVRTLPIGSSIVLPGPGASAAGNNVPYLVPNYSIAKEYLTMDELARLWNKPFSSDLPPSMDFDRLSHFRRLDDKISLVRDPGNTSGFVIFKSSRDNIAWMYHEIRVLLQIPPHPSILSKPRWLITRRIDESDDPVVCGFIVDYYPAGSLDRQIRAAHPHGLSIHEKLRWSQMIVSALRHVHEQGNTYYPSLKLGNLVLSDGGQIILIDFEQAGARARWVAPELWLCDNAKPFFNQEAHLKNSSANVFEDKEDDAAAQWARSMTNPCRMPHWPRYSGSAKYGWKPYSAVTDRERQNFEVYALGKILWCIFELQCNEYSRLDERRDQRKESVDSDEQEKECFLFPCFSERTPPQVRYFIWLCTRQSPEWGKRQCQCETGETVCGESGARYQASDDEPSTEFSRPSLTDVYTFLANFQLDCGLKDRV